MYTYMYTIAYLYDRFYHYSKYVVYLSATMQKEVCCWSELKPIYG